MISERLHKIICSTLGLQEDEVEIKDDTLANQVPGWDSLNHVNVITAIEKDFAVRFKSIEVLKCKNVGDLQKLVDSKINK
ncbi:MAG: acyl carrier protein [Ignavibacteriales bacterium CG_4_9_14_3_um_filter_34_10]|nr:MAG: acyl carrier protein [Ignavibacteriales bacterium CG_4_9_14_3_um_filter_34_10]